MFTVNQYTQFQQYSSSPFNLHDPDITHTKMRRQASVYMQAQVGRLHPNSTRHNQPLVTLKLDHHIKSDKI